MNDVKSCLLVGVGGQGAILISKIMSNGFMKAGYDVKQSEVHGMAQRGGVVTSHVRFGKKVWSPVITPGTADILVAFELAEGSRWADMLRPGGIAMVKGQRNKEAAKKYYDWLMSPAGQSVGAKAGSLQVPANKTFKLDPRIPPLDNVNLIKYDFDKYGKAAERRRLLERWSKEIENLPR